MATLGSVLLDVVTEERVDRRSELTSRPVENGSDINDHIKRENIVVSLQCILVNPFTDTSRNRIVKMWEDGDFVTYKGRNTYHNMQIVFVSDIATPDNEAGYTFEILIEKPRIARLQTYKVIAKNPKTKKQDAKTSTRVNAQTNTGTINKTEIPTTFTSTGKGQTQYDAPIGPRKYVNALSNNMKVFTTPFTAQSPM